MAWGRPGLMRPGQLTYQYIHGFMDCFLALWRGWWWDRISMGRISGPQTGQRSTWAFERIPSLIRLHSVVFEYIRHIPSRIRMVVE